MRYSSSAQQKWPVKLFLSGMVRHPNDSDIRYDRDKDRFIIGHSRQSLSKRTLITAFLVPEYKQQVSYH